MTMHKQTGIDQAKLSRLTCKGGNKRAGQRGASLIEFSIVAPAVTLVGMGALQFALMFNAKNHLNHAAFMAARAGATNHAVLTDGTVSTASIQGAYIRALVPLYIGESNPDEIEEITKKAREDLADNLQIEIINPTQESFVDWNDAALSATLGKGKGPNGSNARVIRNTGQAHAGNQVGTASGQTIQEANLLKIRVTHGYQPAVPVMSKLFLYFYQHVLPQSGLTAFEKQLLDNERIPVITQATVQMQSHPIWQQAMASIKNQSGGGDGGTGSGSGSGDGSGDGEGGAEGSCSVVSCEAPGDPASGGGGDGAGCVMEDQNYEASDSEILYFAFDSAELTDEAKADLDDFIDDYKDQEFDGVEVHGFTDRQGDAGYNMELSKRRAQAVQAYLKTHGFTDKPIKVIAKGETDPKEACPGDDAAPDMQKCLASNRRVVITLKNVVIGSSASQTSDEAAPDQSADPDVSP
jgi:outer membrane protein OmpA-like peptidoglycan-associated protein